MLFHTWTFVLFFLIVYPVYLATKGTWFKLPWLLAASYVFYGWWNPLYLLLILFATTVDYLAVVMMSRSQRRKLWVAFSVAINLSLLGFFKYAGFVTESLNALLASRGASYALPAPDILLPVGISFFIFQSMSYSIDYYRGQVAKEPSFIRYATFVSLFPQLVAGPIERASHLLPQLHEEAKITREDIADGLSLFIVGLFKKLALADCLALYVDKVYDAPANFQAPALILATVAFGWQIYFDFSGYTDMARGIGRMMGIRLMLNFNNPYLATSLGDFWKRWHISLSTWFKDYVYIPLGGNRGGSARTYVNMALTMVISGLWHGASWTFVAWGALHALGRVATRWLEATPFYEHRIPTFAKRAGVYAFVTFAWIFFRARSFADAWLIVRRIFRGPWVDPQLDLRAVGLFRYVMMAVSQAKLPLLALGLVLAVWAYQWVYESRLRWALAPSPVRVGLVIFMALYIAVFARAAGQPFIYFQF